MNRLITLAIKLIPIITLIKGISSGSNKLIPLLNLGKIAMTQYELKIMASLVIKNIEETNRVLAPEKFAPFLQNNMQSEYAVIARDFTNNKNKELNFDLWGTEYKLYPNTQTSFITLVSAGQDRKYNTKDDIKIPIDVGYTQKQLQKMNTPQANVPQKDERSPAEESFSEFDEFGRDREGFDRNGFDKEGYNRDGFDRHGYDRDGYNRDGQYRGE